MPQGVKHGQASAHQRRGGGIAEVIREPYQAGGANDELLGIPAVLAVADDGLVSAVGKAAPPTGALSPAGLRRLPRLAVNAGHVLAG